MFDLRNLEVTATIDFTERAAEEPIDPLSVHYLRLDDLMSSADALTRAIERHLGELIDSFHVVPDPSDPETLIFRILGPENTDLYHAGISLSSRCEEPLIDCEQWGISEVASHLGVAAVTVRSYLSRHQMPAPDGHISNLPWWDADRIRAWDRPRARSRRK